MASQAKNGGALLSLETGLERAIGELKQMFRVPKEIQRLITTMNRIKAVLKDAEEKQISSHAVRIWLQELKQVVFDAEDVIDEFITDVALQSTDAGSCNISTMISAMRGQIREINDRLDDLAHQTAMLSLQTSTIEDSRHEWSRRRQTSSLLPDETSVVGRDREKERIIRMLLSSTQDAKSSSNSKGFSVLPIVGMGGMGKTTLAQLVFNDQNVKKHFELMMWVCVSYDFDPVRLTKEMIDAASAFKGKHEQYQATNWDSMQRRLLQDVEGKTFLLVLDDVWEEEQSKWEELLKPLHFGKKGSKVLVTARNRAFVGKMRTRMDPPIVLRGLSDGDIWSLFRRYALSGATDADGITRAEYSHLEDIGRHIVRRLKGSPLAAITIGSLLNNQLDVQHWKTVQKSEFWRLEQGEDGILPALQLSYQYLGGELKQCFAYCSLFPKDHIFSREHLVQLWEAQSFIKKDTNTRMEVRGSKYFDELLYRSFFEPVPSMFGENDYVVHHLAHDLAEYVSRDDIVRLEDRSHMQLPDTVRHISVCVSELDQIDLNKFSYERLRTLLFLRGYYGRVYLSTRDLDELFLNLKMLRVLGLRGCGIGELPGSIGDLKHLRYIDLEKNDLVSLPKSVGTLYNLQVLNLKDCGSVSVLPATMSQLVNLRHLRADYELVSGIDGLGRLTGLQELEVRGRQVRELGGMRMLRELTVNELEEVGSEKEAAQARLHDMENLHVLQLDWCYRSDQHHLSLTLPYGRSRDQDTIKPESEEEVLQALRPSDGIQELHIRGYGGVKSPHWMEVPTLTSFSSLRHVSLHSCSNWRVLPSSLSQLRLLEYLDIMSMPEWEEWSCLVPWHGGPYPNYSPQYPSSATLFFPCLRELAIKDCPKLKELPLLPPALRRLHLDEVGLCRLPGLWGCHQGGGGTEKTTPSSHSPPVSASLSTLLIYRCCDLTSISGLLRHHLPDLEMICISYCEELVSLPKRGFGHLLSLKTLQITECPKLTCPLLMQEEGDAPLQHLPCSLEQLEINQCGDAMGTWWWAGLQRLTSITQIFLHGCPTTAEFLFVNLGRRRHPHLPLTLRELLIDGSGRDYEQEHRATSTSSSQSLPTPPPSPVVDASSRVIGALNSLSSLTIQHSPNVLRKWGSGGLPSSLERLAVAGDSNLDHECLSACLHGLIYLKQLTLGHLENLCSLPSLSGLTSLETLDLESCPSIEAFAATSLPNSLKKLTLNDFKNLRSLPHTLNRLSSLRTLEIHHCTIIQSLPDTLSHLSSLETLRIFYCPSIKSLPDTLSCLTSLKTLSIYGCPSIQFLPDTLCRLSFLDTLNIFGFPSTP
ncbi:hypothetical protein Taro_022040 [Colocasia esculenta]|uniref:Disease resistance protein RGA3 n=1 Tax=Colocasia esculenta TaxID=4460 RepID=A0A843V0K3_COLES|nr:hypothetical protein [Colocasia esculenta]